MVFRFQYFEEILPVKSLCQNIQPETRPTLQFPNFNNQIFISMHYSNTSHTMNPKYLIYKLINNKPDNQSMKSIVYNKVNLETVWNPFLLLSHRLSTFLRHCGANSRLVLWNTHLYMYPSTLHICHNWSSFKLKIL